MASDNDKMNKKPNTLEDIGSSLNFPSDYASKINLAEHRARIITQDITKAYDKLEKAREDLEKTKRAVSEVPRTGTSEELIKKLIGGTDIFAQAKKAGVITQSILDYPGGKIAKDFTQNIFKQYEWKSQEEIRNLEKDVRERINARREVAASMLEQNIISSVSAPRKGITALFKEPNVVSSAQSLAANRPLSSLKEMLAEKTTAIQPLSEQLVAASADVIRKSERAPFLQAAQGYESGRREIAAVELAMKMKEKQKFEDERLLKSSRRLAESVGSAAGKRSIELEAAKGDYGSVSEIKKKIAEKEKEFIDTLSKFREELNKTGEVTGGLRDKLSQAKSSLEEHNIALKARQKASEDRFRQGIDIVRTISKTAGYGFIGADEEQLQLRIQAASMMNKKFNDIFSASQGDMAALRRVQQGQFQQSSTFGGAYANRALASAGADIALNVAEGVAAGYIAKDVRGVVSAGGDVVRGVTRMAKGITSAERELGFASQYTSLLDTVNQVPDLAKQAYFDFKTSVGRSMVGAGGSAIGALYTRATSADVVKQLADLGVSPESIGNMFNLGISTIGPSFSKDPNRAVNIVSRAAEMEKFGVMNASQYMQSVAQMTGVGGNEKTVEDIFASAVARGVDDAKSLKGIVDLTTMMSRDAASRGVAVAPGLEKAISTGLGLISDLPIDESLKQGMVGTMLQQSLQRYRDSGVNLENISTVTALAKYNIKPAAGGKIATTDPIEARRIYETYKGRLKEGEELPLDVFAGAGEFSEVFVDPKTGKIRSEKEIEDILKIPFNIKSFGLGLGPRDPKLFEKIMSGKASVSEMMKANIHVGGRYGAVAIGQSLYGQPNQRSAVDLDKYALGEYLNIGKIFGTQAGGQADLVTQGAQFFQQQAGMQFNAVTGQMEPTSSLGYISSRMEEARKAIDVEKAGVEAAGAAEKMTLDTTAFDQSVSNFAVAVGKFQDAIRPLGMKSSIERSISESGSVVPYDSADAFAGSQGWTIIRN